MFERVDLSDERITRWRQRIVRLVQTARHDQRFCCAAALCANDDQQQLAVYGWQHLHGNYLSDAIRYFQAALHLDPYAAGAWVGLSQTTTVPDERRTYLQSAFDVQLLLSAERT